MTDHLPAETAPKIDMSRAHPARRYDYLLGGKDNFAADRKSADAIAAVFPQVRTAARENRKLLHRVVGHLAREHGIRQFLDVGTGIPTSPNTHEVAQDIHPDARVVYVDNDPIVLAHARALLTSHPEGRTAYIDADLNHPRKILDDPDLRATLDMDQPVALLLIAVLHFFTDDSLVRHIVTELVAELAPGSFIAVSHVTYDPLPDSLRRSLEQEAAKPEAEHGAFRPRSRRELEQIVDDLGLEPVEPGVVSTVHWRPELSPTPDKAAGAADAICNAYVARRS